MGTRKLLYTATVSMLFLASGTHAAPTSQSGHSGPAPGTANDTMSAIRDSAGHAYGTMSAEVTTSLKGFTSELIVSDMYEVEAARIALKRTQDPRIAVFARQMLKANTANSERLRAVLADLSDAPPLPRQLDSRRQRMIDELRDAKAGDFDGRYLSQQVDSQNEALILLRRYSRSGDVRVAKLFADQTIPAVRMHLSSAQQLENDHDRRS
jgi:putative membrane protein